MPGLCRHPRIMQGQTDLAEPLVQVHGEMRQARQALPTAARMSQLGTESSQQPGTGQEMQEGTAGYLLVRDVN